MSLINTILWKFVKTFPRKVDVIHTDNEPYLLRFHLKHCGRLPGVYFHYFYKSDSDRHLHNHPWKKSVSLILSGGYEETRKVKKHGKYITSKTNATPGSFNKIDEQTFHKVRLNSNKTWTLFVSKERMQDWGFLVDNRFIPHWEYGINNNGTYVTDLLGNVKSLSEG